MAEALQQSYLKDTKLIGKKLTNIVNLPMPFKNKSFCIQVKNVKLHQYGGKKQALNYFNGLEYKYASSQGKKKFILF